MFVAVVGHGLLYDSAAVDAVLYRQLNVHVMRSTFYHNVGFYSAVTQIDRCETVSIGGLQIVGFRVA